MAVKTSLTNSFSKAKFKISEFYLHMNLNESAGDFMIYYSTNFLFYYNVNDCYEDPFQNLLHKISSAVMTKPFGVVKLESGAHGIIRG